MTRVASKKPKLLSAGHPDNFQTPPSALDCLLPYLKREWVIWECARGKGKLVNALQLTHGFDVIGTDLNAEPSRDFMSYAPPRFDMILTNPPFSKKQQFIGRCYELGKPWALLLPITTFDSKERRRLFSQRGIQVLMPNGRINFETPNGEGSSSWFYTAWFTWGLNLPAQIVFDGFQDTPMLTGI